MSVGRHSEVGATTAGLVTTAEASLRDRALADRFGRVGGYTRLACAVAATDDAWLAARGAAVLCALGAGRPPIDPNATLGYGSGLREEPIASSE